MDSVAFDLFLDMTITRSKREINLGHRGNSLMRQDGGPKEETDDMVDFLECDLLPNMIMTIRGRHRRLT